MKKWIILSLAVTAVLALSGCAGPQQFESDYDIGADYTSSEESSIIDASSGEGNPLGSRPFTPPAPSSSQGESSSLPDKRMPSSQPDRPPEYLEDFFVKVVDKNGLPVVNATVDSPIKHESNATGLWQSDADGMVFITHNYTGEMMGVLDYNQEYDITVSAPAIPGKDEVKQEFKLITTKDAIDAGIVLKLDQYDSTMKPILDSATVITVSKQDGTPAKNIAVVVAGSELEPDPDGYYYEAPIVYTNKDGEALFYNLPAGDYVISMQELYTSCSGF